MRLVSMCLPMALAVGCNKGLGLDTSLGPAAGDTCTLTDPTAQLAGIEHACEDAALYNPDIATATSYFVGDFTIADDGTVSGQEKWLLYANPRWLEVGGGDCQVVWNAVGEVGDPANVGDLNIDLSYSLHNGSTDCPRDLYAGSENMRQDYDISTRACASTWFFSQSGTELGSGGYSGSRITYVSGLDCLLF